VPIAATLGVVWIAEHLVEVAIVCGVSGTLAVAASVALLRWANHRDDRQRAAWRARYLARAAPRAVTTVRAEVVDAAEIGTACSDFTVRALPGRPPMIVNIFGALDDGQAEVIRRALDGSTGS
ncbi:MAG: hypothetical protein ACRDPY_28365, partial [Streptosporangiaceae bacterium]